jgi:hypothetical protein
MGRGLASRPPACTEHPHRPATDRCDVCARTCCADCLVRAGRRLLCRRCAVVEPARAAEAAGQRRLVPRLRRLVRERVGGIIVVGLMAGVLAGALLLSRAGGGAGGTAISQALRDEPAFLQRAAAARYCTVGPGATGEVPESRRGGDGGNSDPAPAPVTAPTGARLAPIASVLADTFIQDDRMAGTPTGYGQADPMNLVPYRTNRPLGWRSTTALFPQQVGFELRGQSRVERVAFQHTTATPRDSWAKEVGVLLSTEGPDAGYYLVGRWPLAQTTQPQEFLFWDTPARYVRICLYANYGNQEFVSLGQIALGVWTNDMRAASAPLLPRAAEAG